MRAIVLAFALLLGCSKSGSCPACSTKVEKLCKECGKCAKCDTCPKKEDG
jgi:hypothetical protein